MKKTKNCYCLPLKFFKKWNLLELVRDFSFAVLYLGFTSSRIWTEYGENTKPKYKTTKDKSLTSSSKFQFIQKFKMDNNSAQF